MLSSPDWFISLTRPRSTDEWGTGRTAEAGLGSPGSAVGHAVLKSNYKRKRLMKSGGKQPGRPCTPPSSELPANPPWRSTMSATCQRPITVS